MYFFQFNADTSMTYMKDDTKKRVVNARLASREYILVQCKLYPKQMITYQ